MDEVTKYGFQNRLMASMEARAQLDQQEREDQQDVMEFKVNREGLARTAGTEQMDHSLTPPWLIKLATFLLV